MGFEKMRNDLTDITLIVDRSGSMASCKDDAQGGINTFIEEQKNAEGNAIFSLVQFDTDQEYVFDSVLIQDVDKYELIPRGMTALLDAVGMAINKTGERLKNIPEEDRPGLVIIAVVTDGHENASKEFTKDRIKEMITEQTDKYKWQFTFLGANQDAFEEAGGMGFSSSSIADYNVSNSSSAFSGLSSNVNRMRQSSISGQSVQNYYTDNERSSMIE